MFVALLEASLKKYQEEILLQLGEQENDAEKLSGYYCLIQLLNIYVVFNTILLASWSAISYGTTSSISCTDTITKHLVLNTIRLTSWSAISYGNTSSIPCTNTATKHLVLKHYTTNL